MAKVSLLKPSLSQRNTITVRSRFILGAGVLSSLILAGLGFGTWGNIDVLLPLTKANQAMGEFNAWLQPSHDLEGQTVEYQRFLNNLACDDCSEGIELGFAFGFLGDTFETAFLNANGNLTFGKAYASFTPEPFCLEGPRMIAPFFADVDLEEGGRISYYADPEGHYFIAHWEEVAYFGREERKDQHNSFQLILTDGSIRAIGDYLVPLGANVLFSYADMQWTTGNSSGGTEGFGGAGATVGLNAGDGLLCLDYGMFDREGSAYNSNHQDQSSLGNAVSHLDYQTLAFNSHDFAQKLHSGQVFLDGEAREEGIELRWTTDVLDDTEFFVLERLKDGEHTVFDAIVTVYEEDPFQLQKGEFVFLDEKFVPDTNYYRVCQVRSDSSLNFSSILKVLPHTRQISNHDSNSEHSMTRLLKSGPNPFSDQLFVRLELQNNTAVHYQLLDMAGRIRWQEKKPGLLGVNDLLISLPPLPDALYVLHVSAGADQHYVNLVHRK